jgi:hypothetical protein
MIGDTHILRGSIQPAVSAGILRQAWESRGSGPDPFRCVAELRTDGRKFQIVHQSWDVANLKHIFQIEVQRIGSEAVYDSQRLAGAKDTVLNSQQPGDQQVSVLVQPEMEKRLSPLV